MLSISLCILCLIAGYLAGRRSLSAGLLVVIGVGYIYGIARANLFSPFAQFLFDAALLGLYASQSWQEFGAERRRTGPVRLWTALLIGWPLLVSLLPFQVPLVSLAGLRGNILMLPALLLGTRLRRNDLMTIAYGLAVLNLLAFGTAGMEYFLGIGRFFPLSELTETIHGSTDVAGGFNRIPSTFVNAGVYAGTMVLTLPILFAASNQPLASKIQRALFLLGMVAALLGVLLGASRSHFIVAGVLILAASLGGKLRPRDRVISLLVVGALAVVALGNERLQRFQTLSDKSMIEDRIGGSVNRTFWEILVEYPMGNGLGATGSSVPYFLKSQVKSPVLMESEYARILLEEGVIGLVMWTTFILWVLSRRTPFENNPWKNGRRLAWFCCLCYFGTGLIGVGLLTAVPQSLLLLLLLGWITARQAPERSDVRLPQTSVSGGRNRAGRAPVLRPA